jgi:hypothetical protein
MEDRDLDREVEQLAGVVAEHGVTERAELERRVGGRGWGPGRFLAALRRATEEGRLERVSRTAYGPPRGDGPPGEDRSR